MLKNKVLVVDQASDTSLVELRKFASLLKDTDFGEVVWKLGNSNSLDKTASSTKFACEELRMFPVDTHDNTILSKVYFESQREKIAEDLAAKISDKLDTYIDLHCIPDRFALHQEKTASKADFKPRHLLPSAQMFKVATVEDLNTAGTAFGSNVTKFTLSERVEFSREFAKVATTIRQQDLPDVVQRYCGIMESDAQNVKALLGMRKVAANRAGKSGEEYTKLASALPNDLSGVASDELEKLAETIHTIDSRYGFDQERFERKMPDAYAVVFNKAAEEGQEKDEDEAAALTKADIIARFGDQALEALELPDGSIDQEKAKQFIGSAKDKDLK